MPGSTLERGPMFFENWRAALQPGEILGAYECPLYSDAWIVGETKIGPYQFMNTIAHGSGSPRGTVAPVVVLRVDFHTEFDRPDMARTDTRRYHGGPCSMRSPRFLPWRWDAASRR